MIAERTLGQATISQITKTGEDYYFENLKEKLEASDWGKYVVIESESGDYFVDQDLLEALNKAEEHHPDRFFTIIKIGELRPPATNFRKPVKQIHHAWPL